MIITLIAWLFLFTASPVLDADKRDEVNSRSYSPTAHKYLQAAIVVDENVAAKHGNQTADFLLVLANIVSNTSPAFNCIFCCDVLWKTNKSSTL